MSGDNISARSALGPAVDLTGGGSDAGGSTLTNISTVRCPDLGGGFKYFLFSPLLGEMI